MENSESINEVKRTRGRPKGPAKKPRKKNSIEKWHVEIRNINYPNIDLGNFCNKGDIAEKLSEILGYNINYKNIDDIIRGKSKRRAKDIIIRKIQNI